jgi:hypothetical protein
MFWSLHAGIAKSFSQKIIFHRKLYYDATLTTFSKIIISKLISVKKNFVPKLGIAANLGSAWKFFGGYRPNGSGGDRDHTNSRKPKTHIYIEWALVVPWITLENILLMFLVYRWRCSCSRMLPTSKRDAALVTSFDYFGRQTVLPSSGQDMN